MSFCPPRISQKYQLSLKPRHLNEKPGPELLNCHKAWRYHSEWRPYSQYCFLLLLKERPQVVVDWEWHVAPARSSEFARAIRLSELVTASGKVGNFLRNFLFLVHFSTSQLIYSSPLGFKCVYKFVYWEARCGSQVFFSTSQTWFLRFQLDFLFPVCQLRCPYWIRFRTKSLEKGRS